MRRGPAAAVIILSLLLGLAPAGARSRGGAEEAQDWRILVSPPERVAGTKMVLGEPSGCLSFRVRPDDTRVYLNGRYLGVVDQFDGWPDKLYLPPGEYRLRLNGPEGKAWRGSVRVQAYHEVRVRQVRL
jgi:hypothetical protein